MIETSCYLTNISMLPKFVPEEIVIEFKLTPEEIETSC